MTYDIERAFEKRTTKFIKIRLTRTFFRQLKMTINQCKNITWGKNTFFRKNILLYTINNISMVLEIIIYKYSCILKTMFRNTFPEPQPDSASCFRDIVMTLSLRYCILSFKLLCHRFGIQISISVCANRLLCIVGELSWGGSVAVAVGDCHMWQVTCDTWHFRN